MKKVLFIALLGVAFTACKSEEQKLAEHMCECLETTDRAGFKKCMGDDYDKLGEYDHSDKEEHFIETLQSICPEAAEGVYL